MRSNLEWLPLESDPEATEAAENFSSFFSSFRLLLGHGERGESSKAELLRVLWRGVNKFVKEILP